MPFLEEYDEKEEKKNSKLDYLLLAGFCIVAFVVQIVKTDGRFVFAFGRALVPILTMLGIFLLSRQFVQTWQLPFVVCALILVAFC